MAEVSTTVMSGYNYIMIGLTGSDDYHINDWSVGRSDKSVCNHTLSPFFFKKKNQPKGKGKKKRRRKEKQRRDNVLWGRPRRSLVVRE